MASSNVVTTPASPKTEPCEPATSRACTPEYRLRVDTSEHGAALLRLACSCADFDVHVERLPAGDYLIEDTVLVERKTYADFAVSLVDGRLFPQAAALTRRPERTILLLEGPKPVQMPEVHPHALKGALISLAAMWRLPVVHARDPEESLLVLRFLAQQARSAGGVLKRYDRKPKRLGSRKLYILQGLPGIGPATAARLLARLGSVERVMTADVAALMQVRGVGPTKAARIRELVS